jgi:hypothetical protein
MELAMAFSLSMQDVGGLTAALLPQILSLATAVTVQPKNRYVHTV